MQPAFTSWKELSFLATVLLKHLPDSFLMIVRHVMPSDPSDGIAFTPFAVNLLDAVPKEVIHLLFVRLSQESVECSPRVHLNRFVFLILLHLECMKN